ncbi:MAG: hypothetical protein RMJ03_01725 [Nitrososphaerota archaeon]|nr:hypothetical protein [Nitrososphaerota archaeon]
MKEEYAYQPKADKCPLQPENKEEVLIFIIRHALFGIWFTGQIKAAITEAATDLLTCTINLLRNAMR